MATHGGARNRSGPAPSMFSARSDARDVRALKLPVRGYDGGFPELTEQLNDPSDREKQVWAESWGTPQAAQWIRESWRWRTIAMWVRWSVKMEDPEAPAATAAACTRLADQIGLTPAGLKENGWLIIADDAESHVDQQEKQRAAKSATSRTTSTGKRMRSVPSPVTDVDDR